jgi:hypothetical protein
MWLFNKVEVKISLWVNRWLSRGGRLLLLQFVLSNILVYWASIAKIPKGILTKIIKACFQFLWSGRKNIDDIAIIKWSCITMPKGLSGWGIKKIYWFSRALASKRIWRLIHNKMLRGRVMFSKYLVGNSMEEWFRSQRKSIDNCSMVWKSLVEAFPLIVDSIVW